MANQNTIAIELIVNDNGTATIKNFSTATVSELKKAETAGDSLGAGFAKTWAGIAAGGAAAIYVFQQIKSAVEAPIKAYMESESALLKLGMAMKNQGDFSREALDDLEAFAGSIQALTAYEDDLAIAVMGNLKSYGMTNEEVKKATKTAMDFATAKANEGMTITSASELIGKAYAGNTQMLGRYGIIIDDTIPKSEKFAAVMDLLNQRFGGSAQAELSSYAGQWKQLNNQWGDIKEMLGLVFLKTIEAVLGGIGLLGAAFWSLAETGLAALAGLVGGMEKFARWAGMETVASGIGVVTKGLSAAEQNAKEAANAAMNNATANFKNMISFDKVTKAIDKMGIAGKRTQAIDEEAAAKKKKATEDITEAIRKSGIEIEGIGKTQYEQDIVRITAAAQKYKEDGVDKVLVAKYVATETIAAEKKQAEETKKIQNKSTEETLLALEQETLALGEQMNKEYFAEKKQKEELKKLEVDGLEAYYDLWDKAQAEYDAMEGKMVEATEKAAADRLAAERDVYSDLRGYESQYFAASAILIANQAETYRRKGVDEVAVAAWVAAETEKNAIKKAKSEGDFMAGVKAGYLEMQNNAMTFGRAGFEIFSTFSTESKKAVSDILFQGIKTGTIDTQALWTSFSDSLLRKFTDTISQMVVEAAAKDIVMLFKSEWTAGGSNVLGIVNKVLGFAGNLFSGGGGEGVTNFDDMGGGGTYQGLAQGGQVPNKPVWVGEKGPELLFPTAPGYVMKHEDSVLYAARNGGFIPGYAGGGAIPAQPYIDRATGEWVNSPLGPYVNLFRDIEERGRSGQSVNYDEAYLYSRDAGMHFPYSPNDAAEAYLLNAWVQGKTRYGADIRGAVKTGENTKRIFFRDGSFEDSAISTDSGLTDFLTTTGKSIGIAAAIAAITYGYGAAAGAAYGAATGAATVGSEAAFSGTAGAMTAGEVGSIGAAELAAAEAAGWGTTVLNYLQNTGTNYAKRWMLNQVMNQITGGGGDSGQMSFSYEGANDNGLLASLAGMMGGIAPKSDPFTFSARNGIDYVPRDNFRINAHEGEAVLTKKENAERLRGGVNVTFNLNAAVIDRAALNDFAESIYPRLEKLRAWGH